MSNPAYHILRIALAVTFVWVGIMILRDPVSWGAFVDQWAVDLIPLELNRLMFATGVLDIAVGGLFLFNIFTRFAALLASVHLAGILITSGIDAVTVRDIGLLGATLALMLSKKP